MSRRVKLPWPRTDPDGTVIGLDLNKKYVDVQKLLKSKVRPPSKMEYSDWVQEAFLYLLERNYSPYAYDPRRGAWTTYVVVSASYLARKLHTRAKWDHRALYGETSSRRVQNRGPDVQDAVDAMQVASVCGSHIPEGGDADDLEALHDYATYEAAMEEMENGAW